MVTTCAAAAPDNQSSAPWACAPIATDGGSAHDAAYAKPADMSRRWASADPVAPTSSVAPTSTWWKENVAMSPDVIDITDALPLRDRRTYQRRRGRSPGRRQRRSRRVEAGYPRH